MGRGEGEGKGPEGRKEKKMSHVARRKKGEKGGIPINVMSLDATWVSSLEVHRREGYTKH